MLLVGASQGFAPNAASRVAISRTSAPQMKCCTDTGPNFGDNTYARREMLATMGPGGELPGGVAEHRPAFRSTFGDNTAARAEMLSTMGPGAPIEGGVAQPTNTFYPNIGDNAPPYWGVWP